jgi:hypothetical protein
MRPLSPALCVALWALASASGCTRPNPLFDLGTASRVDAGNDARVAGQIDAVDDTKVGGQDDDAGQGAGGTGGGASGGTDGAGGSDQGGSNGDAASMGGFVDRPLDSGQVDLAGGPAASGVAADVVPGSGCLASSPHNCGAGPGINSLSFNYTVSGGSNNFIVVGVTAPSVAATIVTYRGVRLPAITAAAAGALGGAALQLFGGVPAASGTDTASATSSGDMAMQVFSFVNVDASNLGNSNTAIAVGAPTITVTTAQGEVLVDYAVVTSTSIPTLVVTNSATIVNISKHFAYTDNLRIAAGSWRPASASPSTTTTASYAATGSGLSFRMAAIALRPMPGMAIQMDRVKVIPENPGNIEPTMFHQYPTHLPSDMIWAAEKTLVVRDGVASFHFHPIFDLSYLRQTVDGIRAPGYTFVSPATL